MNATSCFFQNDSQEDGGPITVSTSLPPIIWRLDEVPPLQCLLHQLKSEWRLQFLNAITVFVCWSYSSTLWQCIMFRNITSNAQQWNSKKRLKTYKWRLDDWQQYVQEVLHSWSTPHKSVGVRVCMVVGRRFFLQINNPPYGRSRKFWRLIQIRVTKRINLFLMIELIRVLNKFIDWDCHLHLNTTSYHFNTDKIMCMTAIGVFEIIIQTIHVVLYLNHLHIHIYL